jgi:amino acid transporter
VAESADPTLRQGSLGVGDIVFFVVSAAAPLLVMAGVAPYAILKAGLGVPDAYLFAGVVLAVFAVGFTTMSKYVPNAGAFYAYVTKGMGRPAGVAAALTALMSYNALQIGMYGLLGVAAQATFASLWNINLPWPLFAFAGIVFVWFLGYKSVHFGARVLAVFLTAESAILLLLAIAILVKGGASGIRFDSFTPAHALNSDTGSVLAVAFAAFMGFESTVIYRAEARDPKRAIPRATYIAVGFLALFYGFIVWTIIQAFGAGKVVAAAAQDPAGLFFTAATQYLGTWAADTMHVLMISSVLASLLAFHNAVNRYTLAIADEGMLPSGLGRIHPRTGSPYVAGILQTVLAAVIVGGFAIAHADPYLKLLIWVNTPGVVGLVLLQVMVALSAVIYFRRNKTQDGIWRTMIAPILATAGMVASLYLMITNISLLTGASAAVNRVILLTVPVVVIAGLAWAVWLRRFRPAVYARIAATDAANADADADADADAVPSLGADQIGEADNAKVG